MNELDDPAFRADCLFDQFTSLDKGEAVLLGSQTLEAEGGSLGESKLGLGFCLGGKTKLDCGTI